MSRLSVFAAPDRPHWGNLSTHITRLKAAGYVAVTKEFFNKKSTLCTRLPETADGLSTINIKPCSRCWIPPPPPEVFAIRP
ncbi:transcriptional regulator [Chloroflexota bacterium]